MDRISRDRKFDKWRERVRKSLPELSMRVFALRGKSYMGCGFGWSHEKDLGYIIRTVSNYDSYPDNMEQMLLEIVVEGLYKDLNKIEYEIKLSENGKDSN